MRKRTGGPNQKVWVDYYSNLMVGLTILKREVLPKERLTPPLVCGNWMFRYSMRRAAINLMDTHDRELVVRRNLAKYGIIPFVPQRQFVILLPDNPGRFPHPDSYYDELKYLNQAT